MLIAHPYNANVASGHDVSQGFSAQIEPSSEN